MKNLTKLLETVLRDCDSVVIPYGTIIEIAPNFRAKRWGMCTKITTTAGVVYKISINSHLLDDDLDDRGALDTIAHEVIHTVPGAFNHGARWIECANRLNRRGYNIKRTNTASEKGLDGVPNSKYMVTCTKCGTVNYYQKRGKVVDAIMQNENCCVCGKCKGTKFTVRVL